MQLRFSQIHVTILNFVLIAVLAIVSAMCVRDIIVRSVSNEPDAAAPVSARSATTGMRARPYYDLIVKRDIFNETPQESGPAPVVEADLNLKLIGTSLASRSKPYAIIEDPAGNETLYQVGEDIPDAGKLVSVETNRALIDRGGHRVAIEIPTSDIPEVPPSQLGNPVGGIPRPHAAGTARGDAAKAGEVPAPTTVPTRRPAMTATITTTATTRTIATTTAAPRSS